MFGYIIIMCYNNITQYKYVCNTNSNSKVFDEGCRPTMETIELYIFPSQDHIRNQTNI